MNEYKDWRADRIEEEKQIVKKYPFLRARDINGNIDTEAEFPMLVLEIPNGWYKLFYQMCDDIKPILEEKGILNDFYFIQVKEKFNQLVCYAHQNIPEVDEILKKYEFLASFVCTICGAPAEYETYDYISSFCRTCFEKHVNTDSYGKLVFVDNLTIIVKDEHYGLCDKTVSLKEEWDKYLKENDYERSR